MGWGILICIVGIFILNFRMDALSDRLKEVELRLDERDEMEGWKDL